MIDLLNALLQWLNPVWVVEQFRDGDGFPFMLWTAIAATAGFALGFFVNKKLAGWVPKRTIAKGFSPEIKQAALESLDSPGSVVIGVDELMLWLDDAAENLTPEVILGTFVRFVEIDGKTLNVYFAFDHYGDDFRPKQKKAEPCPEGHSSTNYPMVEPSITKANTVISLETCYLQINRNWFAVIGNLQNTR